MFFAQMNGAPLSLPTWAKIKALSGGRKSSIPEITQISGKQLSLNPPSTHLTIYLLVNSFVFLFIYQK